MTLTDTHCHLYEPPLGDDAAGAIARATARGVTRIVVPAYDEPTWPAIAALAAAHESVFPAYGLHPWAAADLFDPAALAARLTADPVHRAVAIGEIGLDTKIDSPPLEAQLPVLRAQLELAVDHDLPAILHCRGAFEDLLKEVHRHGGRLRGVLHAWSRGPELAERFLAAGLHLGLGGSVTRNNARRLLKAAVKLPLDRIVLETDAPSIGLEGVLPVDTEPGHVAQVAAALAALRGESLDTVAEVTTANACRLFALP